MDALPLWHGCTRIGVLSSKYSELYVFSLGVHVGVSSGFVRRARSCSVLWDVFSIPSPKLSVSGSSVVPHGVKALKLHAIEEYRLQRAQRILCGRFSVRHYIHQGAFGGEQGGGGR